MRKTILLATIAAAMVTLSACGSKQSVVAAPDSTETADPDLEAFKAKLARVNTLEELYDLHQKTEIGSKQSAVAEKLSTELGKKLDGVKTTEELASLKRYAIRGTYGAILYLNKESALKQKPT